MNSSTRLLSLVTAAAALTLAGAVLAPSAALATVPPITPVNPVLHPSKLSISVDDTHVTPGSTVNVTYFLTDQSGNPIMGTETLSEKSADGSVNTVLASAYSQFHKVGYTQAVTLTAPGLYTFSLAWKPPTGVIAASDVVSTQVQVLALGADGTATAGPSVTNAPTAITMAITVPSAAYTTAGTVRVDLAGKSGVASCTTGPGDKTCTAKVPAGLSVGPHTVDVTWTGLNYNFVYKSVTFTTTSAPAIPPASKATTGSHGASSGSAATTTPTPTASTPVSTPTAAPAPAQVVPTPAAGPLTPTTVSSASPIPVVLVVVGLTVLAFLIIGAVVVVTLIRRRRTAIA